MATARSRWTNYARTMGSVRSSNRLHPLLTNHMKLAAALCALLPIAAFSTVIEHRPVHTSHYENILGTSLELKLIGGSDADAARAEAAVLAEIDRLDAILSTWNPNSEVSRWARTSHVAVPV